MTWPLYCCCIAAWSCEKKLHKRNHGFVLSPCLQREKQMKQVKREMVRREDDEREGEEEDGV